MPDGGREWIIDAFGCSPAALTSRVELQALFGEAVSELALKVLGTPVWHQFPAPGGLTGMYLLSESHLCCHTFPELGLVTINLYCCRPRADWRWQEILGDKLGAKRVDIRVLERGLT